MKKLLATSVDVARKAGVSQSTVSRIFSSDASQRGVSKETRAKVLRAAEALGYRPNAIARSLITQKSRIVAVLFSYLDNQFYALALEQICLALQERGYHALVFMMPDTLFGVDGMVTQLLQYQVDGVVTASVELSSTIGDQCQSRGVPVVMFNRVQDDPRLSSVSTDNVDGARQVARYLVAGGHKRIAMIAGWEGASTNRDREFGFKAELDSLGMELFRREVGHFHPEKAASAARQLFAPDRGARPDAVFVANDYMAVPAMETMREELSLRIPEDVSVIGFDDIPIAALPAFDLTTVRQPLSQMVLSTIRILFDRIEGRSAEPEHVLLGCRLIERGSARRPD